MGPRRVDLAASIGSLPADEWDALTGGGNPFMTHAFFSALEDSGSVGEGTGWRPAPLVLHDDAGRLAAALPAYVKSHSQGEYVFDHSWADAWTRAGGRYYPKLQICAPFTPATGPRFLGRDEADAPVLLRAAEELCESAGLSSAHATFIAPGQVPLFEAAGWLIRSDIQFHWANRGYASFDDFL
ncbi:MAG TPA: peptidogalycan biosysnthesis protein, partial [Novosphingobium sp.]|nr:peptidogalycan biosysnthesis protein [Novosphingobium sp.]